MHTVKLVAVFCNLWIFPVSRTPQDVSWSRKNLIEGNALRKIFNVWFNPTKNRFAKTQRSRILSRRIAWFVVSKAADKSNNTRAASHLLSMAWAQSYKGWITLSNGQIAVQRISDSKTYSVIHWIEIYPMDSAIRSSNNRGQRYIITNS